MNVALCLELINEIICSWCVMAAHIPHHLSLTLRLALHKHKPLKWHCVHTFYFAFRQASLGVNLHAHGDAKVWEI